MGEWGGGRRQKQAGPLAARPPAAAPAARGDCLRPAAVGKRPGRGALCPVPRTCPRPAEQRRQTGGELEEADERAREMKPERWSLRVHDQST